MPFCRLQTAVDPLFLPAAETAIKVSAAVSVWDAAARGVRSLPGPSCVGRAPASDVSGRSPGGAGLAVSPVTSPGGGTLKEVVAQASVLSAVWVSPVGECRGGAAGSLFSSVPCRRHRPDRGPRATITTIAATRHQTSVMTSGVSNSRLRTQNTKDCRSPPPQPGHTPVISWNTTRGWDKVALLVSTRSVCLTCWYTYQCDEM